MSMSSGALKRLGTCFTHTAYLSEPENCQVRQRQAADEVLVHEPPQLSVATEHQAALPSTKASGLLGTNGRPRFTPTEMPRVA